MTKAHKDRAARRLSDAQRDHEELQWLCHGVRSSRHLKRVAHRAARRAALNQIERQLTN